MTFPALVFHHLVFKWSACNDFCMVGRTSHTFYTPTQTIKTHPACDDSIRSTRWSILGELWCPCSGPSTTVKTCVCWIAGLGRIVNSAGKRQKSHSKMNPQNKNPVAQFTPVYHCRMAPLGSGPTRNTSTTSRSDCDGSPGWVLLHTAQRTVG